MDFDPKNILLKFTGPPDDVLGNYVNHIANGGLTSYRRIIQWGNKNGQPLYAHVVDLIFTFARLNEILKLDANEQRVMMLALSIHDLNKVPGYSQHGTRYVDMVTPESIAPELERIGASAFFPEWQRYIDDIVTLMKAHSDHYHHAGETLMASGSGLLARNYGLGDERVKELAYLMKGLDALDLSHTLDEKIKKRTFLDHLNTVSSTQYELVSHVFSEQRGLLTNVIHNRIAAFMAEQKEAIALLYYPDGVVYLTKRGAELQISEDDYIQMAQRVTEFLEGQTRGNFTDFIKPAISGIKIDAKCLELGIPFVQLWEEVDNIIQGKTYPSVENMEAKARQRADEAFADDESLAAESARTLIASREYLVPHARTQLQLGELVRSYYNFLSKHFKKQIKDTWLYLYELLDISDEDQAIYAYFNLNYDRSYVIAPDLKISYQEIMRRILEDGSKLLDAQQHESPWFPVFERYVHENVQFSFQSPRIHDFTGYLEQYVNQNHKQSAYGSTVFGTELWRSGDVAKTIKVQQFSNRRSAGRGDPVKYVDPVTKAQFLLEKLNYPPAARATTFYLHIYPYSFFSHAYLSLWRRTIQHWGEMDVSALFLKTDDSLRAIFADEERIELVASSSNSNGLPLPGAPEMLGNLLIWPLNAPGKNNTEQFWYAFTCAFAMQRFIGGRVVLSRSAMPIVGTTEFDDLFVDEIPISLSALLSKNNYNYEERQTLEDMLKAIYAVNSQVFNAQNKNNELLTLIESLHDGPLGIYFAAERLLALRIKSDKKARQPEWVASRISYQLSQPLRDISKKFGGKQVIETIQNLAQLAWDGNLKGQSLEKNALMMPLSHCLEKLQLQDEPIDLGTLRAATITDIYSYLERIREKGMVGDATQQKSKAFVDEFFDVLLAQVYKGNRQRLLGDEKMIRSAFLFHIREILGKRAAENAADKGKEKSSA